MSTRNVLIVGGALGALGLGASAAAGIGPFASQAPVEVGDSVTSGATPRSTLTPSPSPAQLDGSSAVTTLTVTSAVSVPTPPASAPTPPVSAPTPPASAPTPVTPPDPQTPPSAPSPVSVASAESAESAD